MLRLLTTFWEKYFCVRFCSRMKPYGNNAVRDKFHETKLIINKEFGRIKVLSYGYKKALAL